MPWGPATAYLDENRSKFTSKTSDTVEHYVLVHCPLLGPEYRLKPKLAAEVAMVSDWAKVAADASHLLGGRLRDGK